MSNHQGRDIGMATIMHDEVTPLPTTNGAGPRLALAQCQLSTIRGLNVPDSHPISASHADLVDLDV